MGGALRLDSQARHCVTQPDSSGASNTETATARNWVNSGVSKAE